MISSSLISMYFRSAIATYITQYAAQVVEEPCKQTIPLPVQELRQADLLGPAPAVQAQGKSDESAQTAAWEAM